MKWTDKTTSRLETAYENLFGEAIQLHQTHLLEDVLRSRPVIVRYQSFVNYVVESLIMLLFIGGITVGWRSRFLWMTLSFLAFDLILHMGLGFGINEIYIMTAHYMYALPITMAFLFVRMASGPRWVLRAIVLCLTAYLWASNGWLLTNYMLG